MRCVSRHASGPKPGRRVLVDFRDSESRFSTRTRTSHFAHRTPHVECGRRLRTRADPERLRAIPHRSGAVSARDGQPDPLTSTSSLPEVSSAPMAAGSLTRDLARGRLSPSAKHPDCWAHRPERVNVLRTGRSPTRPTGRQAQPAPRAPRGAASPGGRECLAAQADTQSPGTYVVSGGLRRRLGAVRGQRAICSLRGPPRRAPSRAEAVVQFLASSSAMLRAARTDAVPAVHRIDEGLPG
jgi:hypothetical protein